MKKIIIISVILHAVLLVALAPWLKTKMEFSKAEEAKRAEEVRQRELERQEFEKRKREKQKLTAKQAKQLKREAELRKREELKEELERLRELRDQIAEKHREELARLQERTREDVIEIEHIDFKQLAEQLESEVGDMTRHAANYVLRVAGYRTGERSLDGHVDDLRVYRELLSDEKIASPPDAGYARRWRFEENLRDEVSGEETGELKRGAEFAPAEIEGASALKGDGEHSFATLGDQDFGDAFTITTWVKAAPSEEPQLLFGNANWRKYNLGFRLEVLPGAGAATELGLITSGKKGEYGSKAGSSLEDVFPWNEWVRVALRFDRLAPKAEIFINGKNVTAPDLGVAPDTFAHATEIDGSLLEQVKELKQSIEEEAPTPENAGALKQELADLSEKFQEKMERNPDLNHVRHLLNQSDKIAEKMTAGLDALDQKVDMTAMNDTSAATATFDTDTSAQPADAAEMYEESLALEQEIAEANADIQAAVEAGEQNTSYADARAKQSAATPARPDLAAALQEAAPGTVGELNQFRDSLGQAQSEMQDMNARAETALGIDQNTGSANAMAAGAGQQRSGASFASQAARINAARGNQSFGSLVDMTAFTGGASTDGTSQGMREDMTAEGANMKPGSVSRGPRIDERDILKKALPGRRFTNDSLRQGWLYIDTWYVIGPWENEGEVDYSNVHPPERVIDFDARYTDGKFGDEREHRDSVLKWEFYQSDQARCQPPRVHGASTYYAYTDLWFEQGRDMLIAVASDDAARVWLNGQIVWQDEGQSPWRLGEGYRRVHFNKGYNDLLVRIENGPTHCVWSVLLCPPEVVEQ